MKCVFRRGETLVFVESERLASTKRSFRPCVCFNSREPRLMLHVFLTVVSSIFAIYSVLDAWVAKTL